MILLLCYTFLNIHPSTRPVFLSVCLYVCMNVGLPVCLVVWLSDCLSIYLSVCLSVCLSGCLTVCLALTVCLFVCLSIHDQPPSDFVAQLVEQQRFVRIPQRSEIYSLSPCEPIYRSEGIYLVSANSKLIT